MKIKKSKIEKIKELDPWNDLFKYEMHFEDGTEGFMFKKTNDPMCSVGEIVQFTQNEKGTIKIVKEGSEKFINKKQNFQNDDELIMVQCMFKAAATFYAHKASITEKQVAETAQMWFNEAKEILKNNSSNNGDSGSHQSSKEENTFVPF